MHLYTQYLPEESARVEQGVRVLLSHRLPTLVTHKTLGMEHPRNANSLKNKAIIASV